MTEKITAERVCKILEGMYLLDMHEKWEDGKFTPNPEFPHSVYKWCHILSDTCIPHEDWVKDFLEMEEYVLDAMQAIKTNRI